MTTRLRLRVEGVVQGVGFRPFVHALAVRHGLAGLVGNDTEGVFIEVEGPAADVAGFAAELEARPPPLAVIERVTRSPLPPTGERGFAVAPSRAGGGRGALVSPDTATCADCLRELFDPADRRFRYPFVNCTNCGPRYTIIRDVPYDRARTTMAGFAMCGDCAREYADPGDRRFHAQPVCCPACGPTLRLAPSAADPLSSTVDLLGKGRIVAVKGLGGYHLAADARNPAAVSALRSRKHREDKPFAVMVADLAAARELCTVDATEEALLTGTRRPVVLLRRLPGVAIADAVAPGNRCLGLMLPYTPLHHLLAAAFAGPFVLTSGNVSDEPIAHDDADAQHRLAGIADAFLVHDRPIHVRVDDSVTRVFAGRELPVRRARGYAPQPLPLRPAAPRPVLGCGAELKSTFCLAKGARAFVSPHIGDLENAETLLSYVEGVAHFRRLFDIEPAVIAHDRHPEYLSTKWALDLDDDRPRLAVQHHHAHIASCLADNGEQGPAIGVAFDGLGFGDDGTLWGGEFLVADLTGFTRAGFLDPVPMPGGPAAIRQPWRMAAAYLDRAYAGHPPPGLAVARRNAERWSAVISLARTGVSAPLTSSAGRLFDAVAALLGVRDGINYEGQAAIELERLADPAERGAYPTALTGDSPFRVDPSTLIRSTVDDLRSGVPAPAIAARFHRGLAATVLAGAERIRAATDLGTVALSGGVFQNLLLLDLAVAALTERGFRVLTHHRVPPNDGGISLGQVAIAAALDSAGTPLTDGMSLCLRGRGSEPGGG